VKPRINLTERSDQVVFPILFKIGPLTIHTYGVMVALGMGVGLVVLYRLAQKDRLDGEKVLSLALWLILGGFIGARLAHVVLSPDQFLARPWRIFFIWEGGLAFYGGVIVALALGWWLARRRGLPLLRLMDVAAPALAVGQAFGRLGCFSSGDSFGRPFDGPWAVTFTDPHSVAPRGIPLHPTQLYASAALFLIFLVLLWLWPRRPYSGQIFFVYGLLHGTARLIVEQFRGDWRGEPILGLITPTGLFALGLALFSLLALVWLWSRRREPSDGKKLSPSS